jgi:hypothetical protein
MSKINKLFRKIKTSVRDKITNTTTSIKIRIKNGSETFQENFEEAKKNPVSKRKAFLLGFTSVTTVVGVMIFAPMLPAFAKEIPKDLPKPNGVVPVPPPPAKDALTKAGRTGMAAVIGGICGAAFGGNGRSFVFGALGGLLAASRLM